MVMEWYCANAGILIYSDLFIVVVFILSQYLTVALTSVSRPKIQGLLNTPRVKEKGEDIYEL